MKIGYARVSTRDQHLDLQLDALLRAHVIARIAQHRAGLLVEDPNHVDLVRVLLVK